VDVEGEYDGPNIQYSVGPDSLDRSSIFLSNYTMMSLKNFPLSLTEKLENIQFLKLWTIPNRKDAFYVFTQNYNNEFKADRCLIRDTPDTVVCL
jgi:hypothetical protein